MSYGFLFPFKEPERPAAISRQNSGGNSAAAVAAARNSVYTSSLRRTKNKTTAAAASALSAQSDSEAASSKLVLDNYGIWAIFDLITFDLQNKFMIRDAKFL